MFHHHKIISCPPGYAAVGGRCIPNAVADSGGFDNNIFPKKLASKQSHISVRNMSRTQVGARLASAAYISANAGNTQHSVKKADKLISQTGYEVVPDLSTRQIVTFYNASQNQYHLAHKGTQFEPKGTVIKDVFADIALAVGTESTLAQHRQDHTKQVLKKIDARSEGEEPPTISASGHSLGGYTLAYSMSNSKYVRNRIDYADVYDPGHNAVYDAGLNVSAKTKEVLDEKFISHRLRGDAVSKSLMVNPQFGSVLTYKAAAQGDEYGYSKAEIRESNMFERAIDAHSLAPFYERETLRLIPHESIIVAKQSMALQKSDEQNDRKETITAVDLTSTENKSTYHIEDEKK